MENYKNNIKVGSKWKSFSMNGETTGFAIVTFVAEKMIYYNYYPEEQGGCIKNYQNSIETFILYHEFIELSLEDKINKIKVSL